MDLDEEELKATIEMKQINKIIAPEEKSADEMFEEKDYKKRFENDKEISYIYEKNLLGENFKNELLISKVSKICFNTNLFTNQMMGIDIELFKTIHKKYQEMGWLDG